LAQASHNGDTGAASFVREPEDAMPRDALILGSLAGRVNRPRKDIVKPSTYLLIVEIAMKMLKLCHSIF